MLNRVGDVIDEISVAIELLVGEEGNRYGVDGVEAHSVFLLWTEFVPKYS